MRYFLVNIRLSEDADCHGLVCFLGTLEISHPRESIEARISQHFLIDLHREQKLPEAQVERGE